MGVFLSLLLQLAVVVLVARLAGAAFRAIGQPPVVGEMCAGILLGPSVLGYFFPAEHARLFTAGTRGLFTAIAQAGVILFMFVVGARVEFDVFRRHSRQIALTATASIVVPFLIGLVLAVQLYPRFAAAGVPEGPFVLFIATALSVTAFPVLARILTDRHLHLTHIGRTALICAAINDAVAWALVASVVGLMPAGGTVAPGVHGVFIAFAAGVTAAVVMPRALPWVEKLERPASRYLLPVFFATVGLRTDLQLVAAGNSSFAWCAAIVVVATVGKLGGTALGARAAGMRTSDAVTLGVLMNTRGLMELVVLNIGHEVGLLSSKLFAMMVVMALVTTIMTGPLLSYRNSSADLAP